MSSINGSDQAVIFTVTTGNAAAGSNPTVAYAFADGTWTTTPVCVAKIDATNDTVAQLQLPANLTALSATGWTIIYRATTVVNRTYTFIVLCWGT